MARKDSYEGQVVAELQVMRDQYKDVRERLVQEIADVDSGIERISLAITNGVRPERKRRRNKRTTAKRTAVKRTAKRAAKAQSNGNGDLGATIRSAVASSKKPVTTQQIAKKVGILDSTARRYLTGLLGEGSIKDMGMTKPRSGRAARLYAAK